MDMDKGLGRFSVILVVIGVRGLKKKRRASSPCVESRYGLGRQAASIV
jgi:hypothetical protein